MAPRQPLLLLAALLALLPAAAPDLAADGAALLAFRDTVGRHSLRNWKNTSTACSWQGVTCASGRVVDLRLPGSALTGSIPSGTLGNLTALTVLSLRFNGLSGGLPADLAATGLTTINLQGNLLSGKVPPVLFSLRGLVRLSLADNNLTGGIPAAFNNLTHLRTLFLDGNGLSGEIPDLDLPGLSQFNVSFNPGLNGSIPAKLRSFPSSAFMGTGLCDGPLGPCPGELPPTPAPIPGNSGGGGGRHKKKLSGGAIAGIAVGCVAALLALVILLIVLCRGGRVAKTRSSEAAEEAGGAKTQGAVAAKGREKAPPAAAVAAPTPSAAATGKKLVFFGVSSPPYDLEDLLRASAEVLGKGTFGTTYKAVLETGMTVAVKRLKDVKLGEEEFREKIEAVGAMENDMLVPLRAYYYNKDEKLLVYDFMPMGTLSALLHGNPGSGRTPLTWETRSNIALAAARGIQYIHSTGPSASHGSIKSSNILLSKSYEARVSDHGLAAVVSPPASPTRVAGYRAPEVTDARKVSQKADVYSFGVLLLELLTGKAPTQDLLHDEGVDLPRWVLSVAPEEWTSQVFDAELLRYENVEVEDMVQLLQLAIGCAAQHPDSRPSMARVVARIEGITQSARAGTGKDPQPEPPAADDDSDDYSSTTG